MNKLEFKVGEKAMYKGEVVTVVSRYVHDRDTPYRIKMSNDRQIQVTEQSLTKVGK